MMPTYQPTPIQTLRGTAWETNQLCVENGHYQRFMQGLQQFRHQIDSDPHTQYILSTIASHVLNIQTYPGAPSRLQFTYLSDGSMELSQNPQGLKARLEFGQGHIRVTQLFNGQVTEQGILPAHGALLHETCLRVNQFAQQCISECQHACRGHHPHAHPAPQARRTQGSAYGGSGRTRSDPRPIMEATLTPSYAPVPVGHHPTRRGDEVAYADYGHAKPREFTDLTPEVDALRRDNARLESLFVEAQRRAENAELHRDDLRRQLATMEGHHARELMPLRQELEEAHHDMIQAQEHAREAHASALRQAQAAEDAHRRLRSLESRVEALTTRNKHLEFRLSDAQARDAQNQGTIDYLTQQLRELHQQADTTQSQMAGLKSEVRRLEEQHQQAQRDLCFATQSKEKAEREVHTLTQSLEEQSAQHRREISKLHTQFALAETKTAESSRRIQELEQELTRTRSSAQQREDALHETNRKLACEMRQLYQTQGQLEEQLSILTRRHEALSEQKKTIELECAQYHKTTVELTGRVQYLEQDLQRAKQDAARTRSLEEQLSKARLDKETTQSKALDLETRLNALEADRQKLSKETAQLTRDIQQKEQEIAGLREQLRRVTTEQDTLQTRVKALETAAEQSRIHSAQQQERIERLHRELQEIQPATEEAQRLRVELGKACQEKRAAEEEATRLSSLVRELRTQLHEMESRRRAEQDQQQQVVSRQALRIDALTQALETAERERIADEEGFTAHTLHLQHQHALQVKFLTSQLAATQQTLEGEVALLTQDRLRLLSENVAATAQFLEKTEQARRLVHELSRDKNDLEDQLLHLRRQVEELQAERDRQESTAAELRNLVQKDAETTQRIQELEQQLAAAKAAAAAQPVICTVLPEIHVTTDQACQTGQKPAMMHAACQHMPSMVTTHTEIDNDDLGLPASDVDSDDAAVDSDDSAQFLEVESPRTRIATPLPDPTPAQPVGRRRTQHVQRHATVADPGVRLTEAQIKALRVNYGRLQEMNRINTILYGTGDRPTDRTLGQCMRATASVRQNDKKVASICAKSSTCSVENLKTAIKEQECGIRKYQAPKLDHGAIRRSYTCDNIEEFITQLEVVRPTICYTAIYHPQFTRTLAAHNVLLIEHMSRLKKEIAKLQQIDEQKRTREQNETLDEKRREQALAIVTHRNLQQLIQDQTAKFDLISRYLDQFEAMPGLVIRRGDGKRVDHAHPVPRPGCAATNKRVVPILPLATVPGSDDEEEDV